MTKLDGLGILDIIIAVILLYFLIRGFSRGFIKQTSTILGLLIALFLAVSYYDNFQVYVDYFLDVSLPLLQFISFAVIFIVANLVIHLLGLMIKNIIDLLFLEPVDRLAGALLGLVKGGLLVYVFVLILEQIPYSQVVEIMERSLFAENFLQLTPLLQENINNIFNENSYIPE